MVKKNPTCPYCRTKCSINPNTQTNAQTNTHHVSINIETESFTSRYTRELVDFWTRNNPNFIESRIQNNIGTISYISTDESIERNITVRNLDPVNYSH